MSNDRKTEKKAETETARRGDDPFARNGANDDPETAAKADDTAKPQEEAEQPGEEDAQPETPEERIRNLEERLKRAVAEQENLRKRMEREKEDIAKYAMANFARDVLGIADNIQRAIEAVPRDAAEKDTALKTFLDGIEVTERELHKAMERHGIARLNPEGEKFDPNYHQAMFEVPTAEQPSGMVIQVVQSGYMLGDRVLRPAMVGVSRAAPGSDTNDDAPRPEGARMGSASGASPDTEQQDAGAKTGEQAPSRDADASDAEADPARTDKPSGQTRGASRLNEPVIDADAHKAHRERETAGRKS